MNDSVFFLYICNFLLIGGLPIIFFKPGQKNIRWLVTALPFFVSALLLIAGYVGVVSSFQYQSYWPMQTDIIATALGISSNSLIAYTIGTHRVPLHLWHQDNDQSDHIVTYGPYEKIRHPFYTSFILSLIGTFVFFPHIISLLMLVYGIVGLILTAQREERNLQKQDGYYRQYMKRTGRFTPKYFTSKSDINNITSDEISNQ